MKSRNFSINLFKITQGKIHHIETIILLTASIIFIKVIPIPINSPIVSAVNGTLSRSIITVTTFEDEYGTGPDCSLREAITAANSDTAFGGCTTGSGTDTIQLAEGTYILTRPGNKEDLNASGDLDIESTITVLGTGSDITIIDGGDLDRIFDIHQPTGPVTARFESLKITNGTAPEGSANSDGENGGGIRSQGNIELDHVIIHSNYAGKGGNETGNGGHGGGIYCYGTLTVYESYIQYNYAGKGGSLSGLGNAGEGGDGGGIMALGTTTIENSFIKNNRAGNGGDGILGQQSYATNAGNGGGIAAFGTTTIINSEISGNYGGNVGAGPGRSGGSGGGIFNAGILTVGNCTLQNNRPGNGKSSVVIPPGYGGGLFNAYGATATIIDSGIHDNREPGDGFRPKGGGIYNDGSLSIINTTIANNQIPYEGGVIYNTSRGIININASTIAYNQSQYGGGIFNASGTVNLKNTLVTGNVGWQGSYDCEGDILSDGYNFIRNFIIGDCNITGDMTGVITGTSNNPTISAIGYYGGTTKTYIPMTGSLLIDGGNPATPGSGGNSCPATDQRGISRPQSDFCHIGAAEAAPQFTVSKNVDEIFTYPGQMITFRITVNNIGGLDSENTIIYDDLPSGLIFEGPITLDPEHPEAFAAASAEDLPELVSGLSLVSGDSVDIYFPVTTDPTFPGGEIVTNFAKAFGSIPQSEGSGMINIRLGWRLSLPLISR